jgi:pectinesterase|tara:strand:+ start:2173 stop:3087 length:915 start_codon:yes stop_codon:yes gene_type:complete
MFQLFLSIISITVAQPNSIVVNNTIVEMKAIQFATVPTVKTESVPLFMDVAFPSFEKDLLPAVIFVHGGSWKEGRRQDGAKAIDMFARGGYFAASIDYRLKKDAGFPAAVHDCKAAVRFLRKNAEELSIDPTRIGIVGFSAGGHLAALVGLTEGDPLLEGKPTSKEVSASVSCVASISGALMPELARGHLKNIYEQWALADRTIKKEETLPSTYVDSKDPPFYILCGDRDPLCPSKDAETFIKILRNASIEVELEIIEDEGHLIVNPHAYLGMLGFIDKHLGGRSRDVLYQSIQELGGLVGGGN